jgi:hypothetical protein
MKMEEERKSLSLRDLPHELRTTCSIVFKSFGASTSTSTGLVSALTSVNSLEYYDLRLLILTALREIHSFLHY